jgi:DNA repair exonuclease SbcCD ATPase subunit
MQIELDKKVESGEIKKYSQAWYDAINDIAAVDTEIINIQTDTEKYQDTINDIHWEHFDKEISNIQAVSKEADHLIDVLSEKDMFDDGGEWTDEGITTLGLYAQKMEAAEAESQRYQEEIDNLNENWQDLGYTEQEYLEKLNDLKDGQYDAVKSYQDSKKAIVDLNKERISAIKEGIDKEIDAYKELTDAKKEELDAEKDLHDFQKSVMEQQRDISDIERQLAALAGDNSASARAKRAQLEAELAEAKANLEETYYDRSISNQKEALDKEVENFEEAKEKEKEALDESLKDTEKVVEDSYKNVQDNTDVVSTTIADTSEEYGLDVNNALTKPWEDGANAIQDYSNEFGDSNSVTMDELKDLSDE